MLGLNGVSTLPETNGSVNETKQKEKPVKPSEMKQLVESQKYLCALSGESLTPITATVDHIIPLSRGGLHCIENAQVVTDKLNRAKGTMTQQEFIDMCVAVANLHGPK